MRHRRGIVALALLAASCAGSVTVPSTPPPLAPARMPVAATPIAPLATTVVAGAANALAAGVLAGPGIDTLPIREEQAARALAAFRTTCPALLRRTDASSLTRPEDWRAPCDAAATAQDGAARGFFATWFEAVQIGDGRAFATGYYEPEIRGSRVRAPGYEVPIYGRPRDLIDFDLGKLSDMLKGRRLRGRFDRGQLVPYFDRTAIEQGAIAATAPVIAWAADPVEIFFLQVQGSGRLRLPDGAVLRIGYDSQNGRDYTGIGSLMRQRGLLAPGQGSMQGIVDWLHTHPTEGRDIMRENKSFVFFREQTGAPRGALGLPVAGSVSAAADPKFVPLGAPVFLSLDRTDATGLWVAQDTGGAIRGSNRFDTFWGAGEEAQAIAGGMAARGTAFVLLPVGVRARLIAGGTLGGSPVNP